MKTQPSKIILINSANCQYAEFDLSSSLHLVALNNRGKTSIINTLQFLYIDKQKDINFGYSADKTWKHYFPNFGSYVLFELNTLTGKKVFGLAATGLGRKPEKFIYNGAFDVEDFIYQKNNCSIPRTPAQLFPILGTRLLKRKLEAKDHRDMLRPWNKQKNQLGTGLIGDTRNYRLFKQLFRQLLQLKGITIKSLKEQVEKVNHRVMEKERQINVQREFKEPYDKIQKRKNELQKLESNQITIEELLEQSEEEKKLQGRLVSYYLKSNKLFLDEESLLNEQCKTAKDGINHLEIEKLPEISLLTQEKQRSRDAENQKLGVLNKDIKKYEELTTLCLQIVIELEQEKKANFDKKVIELQKKIFTAEDENLEQLEKSLEFKQKQIEQKQYQLNSIADTLYAKLKAMLSDEELRKLYQLTNSNLWTLFAKSGDFDIQDIKLLKYFLQNNLNKIENSVFVLPGFRLNLAKISTDTLYQMGNPDFLQNKINSLQEEVDKLKEKIAIVKEQEAIKQQYKDTLDKSEKIKKVLDQYAIWEQGRDDYNNWLKDKENCDLKIEQLQHDLDLLDEKKNEITAEIRAFRSSLTKYKEKISILNSQKKWIENHPPENNWKEIEVNYDTPTLTDLHDQYKKHHDDRKQKSIGIQNKLERLRQHFPAMLNLDTEQALVFLQQELETIPAQEKSINDEWKSIFTTFASHCKGMIESIDSINSYLVVLKRLLKREKISNLKSIEIRLETNQWYRHISKIKEWKEHDLPLFGGADEKEMERLLIAIKPLFDKVKISIANLYDLKLIIEDNYGNEKHYNSLDLESNGTSITAKTIIFISMINEAMKGKTSLGEHIRIPFYVDEIDSLDDANAENIHNTALKLGLIPIFASPKGSGICKRLYQLENNQTGKLTIREKDNRSGKLVLVKPTFERVD